MDVKLRFSIIFCFTALLLVHPTQSLKCRFVIDAASNYICDLSNRVPSEEDFNHEIDFTDANVTILQSFDHFSSLPIFDDFLIKKFPNLMKIELNNFQIDEISATAFETCGEIQEISFTKCRLTTISIDGFKGCSKLRHLRLDYNLLTEITAGLFSGLENLEILNLNGNKLSTINQEDFQHLTGLKKLQMSNCQISNFNVDSLPNVELIDLQANDISSLHVQNFPKLATLNLSRNMLADIAFLVPINLTFLDISMNLLSKIPASLPTSLKTLKFSGNQLIDVDCRIFLKNLEVLELKTCGIEKISFENVENLKQLDLGHNLLAELPTNLRKLEILSINSNMLQEIKSTSFETLNSLKNLDLSYNFIVKIEDGSFRELKNLEKLKLTSNRLEILEFNIFPHPNDHFKELDVTFNSIKSIETNFFTKFSSLLTFQGTGNVCIDENIENIGTVTPDVFKKCYDNYEKAVETTTAEIDVTDKPEVKGLNFSTIDLLITMTCIVFLAILMMLLAYFVNSLFDLWTYEGKLEKIEEKSKSSVNYERF